MVVYLAFFGLIILIAAAAVVLGTPAVEEGTPPEKTDLRRMKFPKVAYLPFGKCSAVSAGYAKRNEVQRSMSCGNFEFF